MNDWNIQSRSQSCQATNRPFEDKEPYHTLLVRTKEGYERLDVCEDAWREQFSEGAAERKGFVSHWRGVFRVPPPKEPDPIERESAESLLRKIVEANDPQYAEASYILAVMLERKRILKVQSEFEEEGRRVFVYEHAKTGDVFTIADPELNLADMEKVQQEVALLMEYGLEGPPPEEEAAAEDGAGEAADQSGGEGDGDHENEEEQADGDADKAKDESVAGS
jgi:hypothetical protein